MKCLVDRCAALRQRIRRIRSAGNSDAIIPISKSPHTITTCIKLLGGESCGAKYAVSVDNAWVRQNPARHADAIHRTSSSTTTRTTRATFAPRARRTAISRVLSVTRNTVTPKMPVAARSIARIASMPVTTASNRSCPTDSESSCVKATNRSSARRGRWVRHPHERHARCAQPVDWSRAPVRTSHQSSADTGHARSVRLRHRRLYP